MLGGTAIAVAGFAGAGPAPHGTGPHGTGAHGTGATAGLAAAAGGSGPGGQASGGTTAALAAYGSTARRPGPGHGRLPVNHRPGHHHPGRHRSRPHARRHLRHRRHHSGPGGPRFHRSPWRIAWSMLPGFRWTHWQFRYLNLLWMRESGWNRYAYNAASGAYGIPQAVPGSKMATAGPDWRSSARTQILWGMSYIKTRYVTPWRAWQHELRAGVVLSGTAHSRPSTVREAATGGRLTSDAQVSSLRQNRAKACDPFRDASPVWKAPGCLVKPASSRRPASISGDQVPGDGGRVPVQRHAQPCRIRGGGRRGGRRPGQGAGAEREADALPGPRLEQPGRIAGQQHPPAAQR